LYFFPYNCFAAPGGESREDFSLPRREWKYVEKLLLPRLAGVENCDILPRPDERTAKRDSVENLQSFFFALQPLYAELTGS
jgi:hypothetical protein